MGLLLYIPGFRPSLEKAFHEFKNNFISFIRFNVLFLSFCAVVSYLAALLVLSLTYDLTLANILHLAMIIPLLSYPGAGFVYYYCCFVRGVSNTSNQIFRGYRWYFNILQFLSVLAILGVLCVYPVAELPAQNWLYRLRTIAGLMFFTWFLVRSVFTFLIIVDDNSSALEAVKKSFLITRNKFYRILISMILLIFFLISGLLLIGIGFIATIGIYMLAYIHYYDFVRKENVNN